MALDVNQIPELLKTVPGKKIVDKAISYEQRLRFHTEVVLNASDINAPTQTFIEWVCGLLPLDKYNTFLQLFTFPLPTPSIVSDVYRELERVFYSRDSVNLYKFDDSELLEDWLAYRTAVLKEPEVWKRVGWEKLKTNTNSILIVDLPGMQLTEKPAPYFYWLDISKVIAFKLKTDAVSFEWIIFKQDDGQVAVFDDTSRRLIKINKNNSITVEADVPHDLGYCPARFFWSTPISEKLPELKQNPITKELANLDWLLFFQTSKKHLDLYAPYPVYSAYEADCNFSNNETGEYCDGGYIRDASGGFKVYSNNTLEKCPACSSKRIAGPGSFIEVPIPNDDTPDMRNPMQITTIDSASLEYNVSECVRLKEVFIKACVGSGGTVSEKEAINETQVAANFESRTAVLNNLKTNFEKAQQFVEDTICRLRYGAAFKASSINWGTEFYVFTVAELYAKLDVAKKAGVSQSELDALNDQILETEYKNSPIQLQRMQILKQLEPYRLYNLDDMLSLLEKNIITQQEMKLKINFSEYINRFERENISITEFGSTKPFNEKVNLILKTIKSYVEN